MARFVNYSTLKSIFDKYISENPGGIGPHFSAMVLDMGYFLSEIEKSNALRDLNVAEGDSLEFEAFLSWWGQDEVSVLFFRFFVLRNCDSLFIYI